MGCIVLPVRTARRALRAVSGPGLHSSTAMFWHDRGTRIGDGWIPRPPGSPDHEVWEYYQNRERHHGNELVGELWDCGRGARATRSQDYDSPLHPSMEGAVVVLSSTSHVVGRMKRIELQYIVA